MSLALWFNLGCVAGGMILGGIGLYRVSRAFKRMEKLEIEE
jgi:hypothetical protein